MRTILPNGLETAGVISVYFFHIAGCFGLQNKIFQPFTALKVSNV